MTTTSVAGRKIRRSKLVRWLLEDQPDEMEGPHEQEGHHKKHTWWQVMCLTGVDYFSTLGYQPGIAALAAGVLSPVATLILVLLTLFGALPIYRNIASDSPHGEGSIAMLEHLLSWWQGKLFVLALLGFVATDFVITITLSAADATAHVVENPFVPAFFHNAEIPITLFLITLLSAVFLKGFKEAIGIAVGLVSVYLSLNTVVLLYSLYQVIQHPVDVINWRDALFTSHGNPLVMIGIALLVFPRLALGLSGFETGVAVMPLVQGDPGETEQNPRGRIRNTKKLLLIAACTMSVFLIASSFATTVLIPHPEFEEGGRAYGRALAFLAHMYFGDVFGTIYDISTISILWFAGASAMAGLLNIVPRYLPRYGMAPDWTRATRPLVLVFTAIAFLVTIVFRANVEAQGGAYATGVLVLMTSASFAVTLATRKRGHRGKTIGFGIITAVFAYTTVTNIIERPDGIKIASLFILGIIIISLISRVWRSTELRTERVVIDAVAQQYIDEASKGTLRLIANRRQAGDEQEYRLKERDQREDHLIPDSDPVLFIEVRVCDASDFSDEVEVTGKEIHGYRVLRAESSSVPNAIAMLLLHLRDTTGKLPQCYFTWTEGNPLKYLFRFVVFGEGDTAPVTREILRQAEPDPEKRPGIHVGG